ncbi:hypothetical protein ACFWCA_32570 [Streptomyces phaeochromogenes]|uniref:hypothetical protein n=1 Tax=Streptomyces phaeochromogenes TaxID=1923 RepID=UPI00368E5FD7
MLTPDDYDRLYDESRDEPAFSNGTEGYRWMAANCDQCIHDKPARQGDDANGCPLVLITLLARTPRQFIDGPRDEHGRYGIATQYVCTEFRGEDERDPTPRPVPTPDGQGELLPREPFEGHRMLTPLPDYDASISSGLTEDFASFDARMTTATDTARGN